MTTSSTACAGAVSAPQPRQKHTLARVGMAFSLAHLCLIRAWYSTLYPAGKGYYNQTPVNVPVVAGLFLNLLLLTLIFKLSIFVLRHNPRVWPRRLAVIVISALLLVPLNFVRLQYFGMSGATTLALALHPAVIGCTAVAVALAWRWYELAASVLRAFLLILIPFALWTVFLLMRLAAGMVDSPLVETPLVQPPFLATKTNQPRIVWLIFDELDYRAAFENRPTRLDLPAFERLRAESLFATRATEPSPQTLLSMPTLLNGRHATAAEPVSANDLRLTFADAPEPTLWSTTTTVFARARELGFNTAVVAWHHPYRRLFGRDLNYCSDYAFPLFEQARGHTLGEAMVNQLWSICSPVQQRRLAVRIHRDGLANALQVVTNPVYGLSLLHLSVPHEPGIYRPACEKFTVTSFSTVEGYFDNLALADRTLGRLRAAMESAGTWDSTWLIVSADHHWRKANLYDGIIDHRVPFIVKAAGARAGSGQEMSFPFDTVRTHDLLLAILRGEIPDSRSALAWCKGADTMTTSPSVRP